MRINVKDKISVIFEDEDILDQFYSSLKRLKKLSKSKKINIIYKCQINKKDKDEIDNIIKAINIKNKKERLSLIYDIACNYIDNEYVEKNFCEFKSGSCLSQRQTGRVNGCCGKCMYLSCNGCNIKSLGCKLYFCKFIRKRKKCIKLNEIKILKYFLNSKQKLILSASIYETKEEILHDLTRKSMLIWALKGIKNNKRKR